MKQGENNLGAKNNVFKDTEEERTWVAHLEYWSLLSRGQSLFGWRTEKKTAVCPEACEVGWTDHGALVGGVLDCSP